jgi:hypothetical protein
MKTAVSIPDDLFVEADDLARRLGVPRSRLFADALAAYLAAHRRSGVTAALDELYADQPSTLDPGLAALQARSLPPEDW